MSQIPLLFHATSIENLASINENGLKAGSYWTNDNDLRDYYVETVEDEAVEASILVIDLRQLQELANKANQTLLPDLPGIEEPITTVLRKREDDIHEQWQGSRRTWQECLDIVKSLKCPFDIPSSALRVMEPLSDDLITLTEHLEALERHRQRHARP